MIYYIIILGKKLFIICQKNLNKFSIVHKINIWERSFYLLREPLKQALKSYYVFVFWNEFTTLRRKSIKMYIIEKMFKMNF